MLGTELFSGGPLSLQPPYPILYPFLCFSHPETATCKTELLRFPSSSAIAFHIPSCNNKSYISLQQPRTDFYIGIRYSPPPSPHPQEQNKTKQNNCFLTFNMSGWCQTLFMESQKSLLFLCKREVRSSRECFRTFISLEMT